MLRELAHLNSTHDVFLVAHRRGVRLRAAEGLGRMDRSVRRRDRPLARDVARRAARSWPGGSGSGRTASSARRKTPVSMSCGSVSIRFRASIALTEFVMERRLRKG